MATSATEDRRKRVLAVILAIIALGALLLIAAAVAGYSISFPWLASSSDGNGGGGALASTVGDGSGGGAGDGSAGGGCFLGLICLNADGTADGSSAGAVLDEDGVSTSE